MTVYEAVDKMREKTAKGETFQFAFMSYSIERKESHGPVAVEHAMLRPSNVSARNRYHDYMLRYVDTDTMEEKSCWQPLIMEFEHETLTLEHGR